MHNPFTPLSNQSLFLVWGPPSHGPRSQVFARELGIRELHFVHLRARRSVLTAPLRYSYQAVQTLRLLIQKRPRLVFVQSPPSFAIFFVYIYCALTRSSFVVDAHSGAFQAPYWTWPRWLYRFLARKAILTIVTNEHFERLIASWGAQAFILRDIPTSFPRATSYPMNGGFNVAVVNTFSDDEPLGEVLQAATALSDVHFYITGKMSKASPEIAMQVSANVHFTDFLPDDQYYALLSTSHAIMCLTTRDHTMQRGACEALSLGKPIITSDWPILREYFREGAVHVPNSEDGIRQGVVELKNHYALYQAGIQDLQVSQRREWESKVEELTQRIKQGVRGIS